MIYKRFKELKQKAFNNCSVNRFMFFAFNDEQFKDGCQKTNAKRNKKGKWLLSRIPGGGFLTHAGTASWKAFWANWDKYEEMVKKTDTYIIDGLRYEYANHEAQFGFGGKESAEELFPEATEEQKKRAWKLFWKDCIDNDWF